MEHKETIAIGWVTHGYVESAFAASVALLGIKNPSKISTVLFEMGPFLSLNRNILIGRFLTTSNADWLLMLDSDIVLSNESFKSLVKSADSTTAPIVSGLCFIFVHTEITPAIQVEKNGVFEFFHDYPKDQVFEVDAAGMGCLLVHRSVLEKLYKSVGIWVDDFPTPSSWVTDDVFFSKHVKDLGYKIFVDSKATTDHIKKVVLSESLYAITSEKEVRINPNVKF